MASLGHSSKFQRVSSRLASLLQRRRSSEANQTLHDVWPSPALVHCIYIFGGSWPVTEFCPVQNSLYVQVLRSSILYWHRYCTALQQRASAKLCGMVQGMELRNFRRQRHRDGWAAVTLGIGSHSSKNLVCIARECRRLESSVNVISCLLSDDGRMLSLVSSD